jgi:hypothetical protein
MTTIPARKNDQNSYAVAIERWDNEGGASSQISQPEKTKECKFPISTNRDAPEDS